MLASRGIELRRFAEELRDAGVTLLQYRDKRAGEEEVLRNAHLLTEVFRGTEAVLVMNDFPALAQQAGWNAVHVGQEDAAVVEARSLLGPGGIVGCSTHNDEQVRAAEAVGADYIAIGPVFSTSTKLNPDPVVGLEGVRRARALTKCPLVAIGGITPENAASVIEAGADAIAVIGALLRSGADPGTLVQEFLEVMPLTVPPQ
ncbi:thiamine phosphate synthase [Edaphobacter sp. 4G125]|nr:thiamine phosphate synthase [Edaphobacter sp. 4G125]